MIGIVCVQLSALKRSFSLGKTNTDNMRQQMQTLVLCFIPVALSIVATLVCVDVKGKVQDEL